MLLHLQSLNLHPPFNNGSVSHSEAIAGLPPSSATRIFSFLYGLFRDLDSLLASSPSSFSWEVTVLDVLPLRYQLLAISSPFSFLALSMCCFFLLIEYIFPPQHYLAYPHNASQPQGCNHIYIWSNIHLS